MMEITQVGPMGPWMKPVLIFAVFTCLGFLAPFLVKLLSRIAAKTSGTMDDVLVESFQNHIPFWFFLAGGVFSIHFSPLNPVWISRIDRLLMILFVLSVSQGLSRFAVVWIRSFAGRLAIGTTTLLENLTKLAIYGMGLLFILSNLGISIAPLLTALGVGSLAVALALQDTLSNLFSGIYIIWSRQIRIGDFIKLDNGAQGYVTDISWRSTTIRERADNHIIIPNTKIAQAVVTNFNLPKHEFGVAVKAGVSYGSDLAKVERVALEVAGEVEREVAGGIPSFKPFLHYESFGDSAVQFSVMLRVKEFEDQHPVIHEFIKRLHGRFKREGIEIPFPQRVVHMTGGK